MNQTETVRSDTAQLVREHVIAGIEDPAMGITFDGRQLVVAAGYRLFRLLPDSGRIVDQLETFPLAGGLAFDGKFLWQRSQDHLQKIEGRTGFVERSLVPELDAITGIECIGSDILVLHDGGRSLARVETLDATPLDRVLTDVPMRGLAWTGGQLWTSTPGELLRIHPTSARILGRLALPTGVDVCDLAGDAEGRVWWVDGRTPIVRALPRPTA
jgi:hypothetical protein